MSHGEKDYADNAARATGPGPQSTPQSTIGADADVLPEMMEEKEKEAPSAEQQIQALAAEVERLKSEYLRALAETENVRRRAARDRQEASQYAIAGFARDLLSVADNLQRAIGSVEPESRASNPALDTLLNGVEMTERELIGILQRHGLTRMQAMGTIFDPHQHEAMFEMPNPSVPHGTVVQVLQDGYTLHDRTLRPARVGLARGGPKPGAAAAEDVRSETPEGQSEQASAEAGTGPAGPADAYQQTDSTGTGSRIDETT